ncbi:MAG: transglutaminase domain-containing protein [Alicyclobacillus herbarius]|uniref:transglutaminase domain-containing protein n=1 Tax=Alicyclobacillus herbarius TaxID=122960 RepID=UPI002353322E|nr:transglutaminase domain-containing protein [Alicyclobacillus herbarius]MCL6631063.1 transglutaminase domain-containing protein [Alicyclobacillus herbarius]
MDINWVTAGLAIIFVLSAFAGLNRGFAYESAHVISLLVSLISGGAALTLAWWGSNRLNLLALHTHPTSQPDWLASLVTFWQQAPGVAQLLAFVLIFLMASSMIRSWFDILSRAVVRMVPGRLKSSRLLGGLLGCLVGAGRCLAAGGLIFLGLQYFNAPKVNTEAEDSSAYQWLRTTVYQPWLKPFMAREIPVLSQGAFQPLVQNISLVAVPSSTNQSQGVLSVPKPIAQLAKQITSKDQTDREKAYALYEWEIHHIHYDWKKYDDYVYHHHWDNQTPLTTLRTHKGVCADYALLYADMAHAVGLTAKIDEGIGGTAQQHGPHAWNEVWDAQNHRWIPLDTTWGSEQDMWFDPPNFSATHVLEHAIEIRGVR